MLNALVHILAYLRSFFPARLPDDAESFDAFCDSVLGIYNIPDKLDHRFNMASMILRDLGPQTCYKSKRFFAKTVLKSISNEAAFSKLEEYKAALKAKNEVTPSKEPITEQQQGSLPETAKKVVPKA